MPTRQRIKSELIDLKDDVKFELSELNNQKELVINGPASQLVKRAIHMSYLQGQKFAIDEISTLIEENHIDEEFLIQYNNYEKHVRDQNLEKKFTFSNFTDIPHQFDEFIASFYYLKGQNFIVTHINSIIE
ncbi:hypothetical protein HMPREF2580_02400 [Staphylococcus sp. HMSC036D05]|uniref:hypothetical protein n=1 Tax=Staphylococcus sp. HMSC036D05 TaxID=1715059 RepID=UPI0008A9EBB6|nr:hypothetical protein [Staphylococcus sp. HMSC036D05]OHO69517.1 hypothetical protein HMPREF2580_02400 [Staphylococcus sp. HMSC036D05]